MSIKQELKDAIESARTCRDTGIIWRGDKTRYYSFDMIRKLVYAVVRELPDDMTVAEIRDELEISENQ